MNIEFENYRMEPEDCRFNLYKKGESTKKEIGEKYESETVLGYAMSFERCLHVIATDILSEKEKALRSLGFTEKAIKHIIKKYY